MAPCTNCPSASSKKTKLSTLSKFFYRASLSWSIWVTLALPLTADKPSISTLDNLFLTASKSLSNPNLSVFKLDEALSLWEILKKVVQRYLNSFNGVYAEMGLNLVLLFLESSILEDHCLGSLHLLKSARMQISDIQHRILRFVLDLNNF